MSAQTPGGFQRLRHCPAFRGGAAILFLVKANHAQKPTELTDVLVKLFTHQDDLVVDPFCGSGSTLVSALKQNRRWHGADIDHDQCEAAEVRIKRLKVANLQDVECGRALFWTNRDRSKRTVRCQHCRKAIKIVSDKVELIEAL